MKTHRLCLIIDFRKFKGGTKKSRGLVLVRSGLQGFLVTHNRAPHHGHTGLGCVVIQCTAKH